MTIAPPERESIRRQIAEWLEAERQSVAAQLGRAGVPDPAVVEVPVVTQMSESSSTTTNELREVNPLTSDAISVWRALEGRLRAAPSPAAALYSAFGDRCWYEQNFMQPDFALEPVAWIDQRLLGPTSWDFLRSLPRLGEADPTRALVSADTLLDFVAGATVSMRSVLPLAGLRLPVPLTSGTITLRRLEPAEVAQLEYHGFDGATSLTSLMRYRMGSGERVMLELREDLDKRVRRQPTPMLQRIVLAFQLLGFAPWGRGLALRRESPISAGGTLGSPVLIPKAGPSWTEVTQRDLDEVAALAARIPDETFNDPRTTAAIALSRYSSASADRTDTDALIDLVVALEAVLLPREFEGELKFRLALYGTYATGADPAERPQLFRDFSTIYDTRSDIVHGKRVQSERLQAVVASARLLTSRVLRHGLEKGWPTEETLRAQVLM